MIVQYVESVRMIRKLSRFHCWTTWVVNGLIVQKAVISSSARDAK